MYDNALTAPPRFQWEANSAPSQADNCGPTSVTRIADFYRDARFSIEQTRRLVADCCRPTSYLEQERMLEARGVHGSLVNITSIAQLRSIVQGGRRPVALAMEMKRVPRAVRGYDYGGWHTVVCLVNAVQNGVAGFLLNDPNFSPPGGPRPDPTNGRRFYSEAVLQSAFIQNSQHWALVPNAAKVIPWVAPPSTARPTAGRVDGDPYPMRMRRITDNNDRFRVLTIRQHKPVRSGPHVTDGVWSYTDGPAAFYAFGRIPKADLPTAEQKYGDVYVGLWYHENGDHIGYVKEVDLQ